MSFLKKFAAGILDSAAQSVDKQRQIANRILDERGERLTDEQRGKLENYAYSDVPERGKAMAQRLRKEDDDA